MGSHSVTCHPTQVNAPRLTPAMQAGTRFTYPEGMEGWVDIVDLIVPRQGVEPATFWSRVRCRTTAPPRQPSLYSLFHACWLTRSYSFFRSGTDPISLLILYFLLQRVPRFKKAQGSAVSNRIGMKFGRIVPQANTHQLMESDFCIWCHTFKTTAMTTFDE